MCASEKSHFSSAITPLYSTCATHIKLSCPSENIQYPKGAIVTPYKFYYYAAKLLFYEAQLLFMHINRIVKYRGFSVTMNIRYPYGSILYPREIENLMCTNNYWLKFIKKAQL
jgi:hypothetical protein